MPCSVCVSANTPLSIDGIVGISSGTLSPLPAIYERPPGHQTIPLPHQLESISCIRGRQLFCIFECGCTFLSRTTVLTATWMRLKMYQGAGNVVGMWDEADRFDDSAGYAPEMRKGIQGVGRSERPIYISLLPHFILFLCPSSISHSHTEVSLVLPIRRSRYNASHLFDISSHTSTRPQAFPASYNHVKYTITASPRTALSKAIQPNTNSARHYALLCLVPVTPRLDACTRDIHQTPDPQWRGCQQYLHPL